MVWTMFSLNSCEAVLCFKKDKSEGGGSSRSPRSGACCWPSSLHVKVQGVQGLAGVTAQDLGPPAAWVWIKSEQYPPLLSMRRGRGGAVPASLLRTLKMNQAWNVPRKTFFLRHNGAEKNNQTWKKEATDSPWLGAQMLCSWSQSNCLL